VVGVIASKTRDERALRAQKSQARGTLREMGISSAARYGCLERCSGVTNAMSRPGFFLTWPVSGIKIAASPPPQVRCVSDAGTDLCIAPDQAERVPSESAKWPVIAGIGSQRFGMSGIETGNGTI
jgi:hypothetical protein